jgi:phosphate starvation-inducible PhoH-like protein
VLLETPGGGVALNGKAESRRRAKQALELIAARADQALDIAQADVRVAIDQARRGAGGGGPIGRRGAVAAKTAAQAHYLELLSQHELVFALGPAGTGKTFLAVAHGAGLLLSGEVDRLVITRPAVEAGERLGFLPGDLLEKVDPYMAPIFEALTEIMGAEQLRRRRDRGEIEVAPIAFMRGRTLAHAYAILDEAQNTTPVQMKMFLTRMGEGTHMVITGDLTQIDLPAGVRSGLRDALDTVEGVQGIKVVRFENRDVVRHPLVGRIVDAYDQRAAAEGDTRREAGARSNL